MTRNLVLIVPLLWLSILQRKFQQRTTVNIFQEAFFLTTTVGKCSKKSEDRSLITQNAQKSIQENDNFGVAFAVIHRFPAELDFPVRMFDSSLR